MVLDVELEPGDSASGGVCLLRHRPRRSTAEIVLDDPAGVAFLDRRPLLPGHVLLVPRSHVATLPDLPVAEVGPLFTLAQHLTRAVPWPPVPMARSWRSTMWSARACRTSMSTSCRVATTIASSAAISPGLAARTAMSTRCGGSRRRSAPPWGSGGLGRGNCYAWHPAMHASAILSKPRVCIVEVGTAINSRRSARSSAGADRRPGGRSPRPGGRRCRLQVR